MEVTSPGAVLRDNFELRSNGAIHELTQGVLVQVSHVALVEMN